MGEVVNDATNNLLASQLAIIRSLGVNLQISGAAPGGSCLPQI